ncbi:hypothetical protein [Mycolicibacterium sphagni]|uniref:hypothetical protein n=1 Tax=Mycolicibacterium sphagni TaxID=1786 RepID=UPI0021F385EA|nr:hypothetical protein [Mycolicibacterium sphagni]MCV7174798.1 hypothetical protein [Mycolicibacterium sphagni]
MARIGDPPDFINPEGVKWWIIQPGIWMTELPTGELEYVGIHNDEIVAASRQLDAVAIRIDLMRHAEKPE